MSKSGLLWSMSIWAEPRPPEESHDQWMALKKFGRYSVLIFTVARLFLAEREDRKRQDSGSGRGVSDPTRIGGIPGLVWLKV